MRPADGERQAQRGYAAQYRVAAELVYRALVAGDLVSFSVADPEAGRVDDFLLFRSGHVDAYQIKWSDYPSTRTFNNLIHEEDGKPSIIHQLSDGWLKVKSRFRGNDVYVHFLTNEHASDSTSTIPIGEKKPTPYHYASFVRNGWEILKQPNGRTQAEEAGWAPAISRVKDASGLDDDEFEAFSTRCYLDYGHSIGAIAPIPGLESVGEDLKKIRQFIMDMVSDDKQLVNCTAEFLLSSLGWEDKFEAYRRSVETIKCENCGTTFRMGIRFCPGSNCNTEYIYGATNEDKQMYALYGLMIGAMLLFITSNIAGGFIFVSRMISLLGPFAIAFFGVFLVGPMFIGRLIAGRVRKDKITAKWRTLDV